MKEGEVPRPWPDKPVDVWDQRHVRMPHSAHSLYPVTAVSALQTHIFLIFIIEGGSQEFGRVAANMLTILFFCHVS